MMHTAASVDHCSTPWCGTPSLYTLRSAHWWMIHRSAPAPTSSWARRPPGTPSRMTCLSTTSSGSLLLPLTALAQAPPGVARGDVVAIDNGTLTLKLADGERQITLPPNGPVMQITPGDRARAGTPAFLIAGKDAGRGIEL
jgi:hypothetical protein